MSESLTGKRLTQAQSIQVVDWLRQHADDLPNLTAKQITDEVGAWLGRPLNINSIRNLAKAANLRWAVKVERTSSNPNSQGARIKALEHRVAQLEEVVQRLDGQVFGLINMLESHDTKTDKRLTVLAQKLTKHMKAKNGAAHQ